MRAEPTALQESRRRSPAWLRSRHFLGPVIAIGGVQLVAAMDGPIAVFALPKIQNELGLSDATKAWVITAYLLTFGGLILLGGRLGDAFGRKRVFIAGVALFTFASILCGVAWNGESLVFARLLHGVAAAIVTPTCTALLATTFPKGPARNAAIAVFGTLASLGAILGLALGGILTEVSWRLAFLINVPIGVLVILVARRMLQESQRERMRLDVAGAVLATATIIAAVFGLSMGPEKGWLSPATVVLGIATLVGFVAFVLVERTAENPIVPFSLFRDRDRLACFVAVFLSTGISFTLTVLVAFYVQTIMGRSPAEAGVGFIPIAVAMAVGTGVSSRLVMAWSPRAVVLTGCTLVIGAMVVGGSTLSPTMAYFPNLLVPMCIGAFGIGLINVPLGLSLVASVGPDRIGPTAAIIVMLQSVGGPAVLVGIQAAVTSRTLQLGGTTGPAAAMTDGQLDALDSGYTHGVLCLGAVALLLAGVALFIRYTAAQVAHARQAQQILDDAADEIGD
ncbi:MULTISPECIES: MFS transporter [Mycobacteriaceae]|uniref:MFS transporter n=1 Tax=Mycobacteriaceae TaxID=1762 RepID=UPI0008017095|nr:MULTISPECIES: MFS transporter [Mycobacteriaceae]MCK0173972.1 MFS transporter [Mycolicibacterium sp. F2034L]OBB55760.1 MFS transporter [Mycobacterium sp. 852013-51886_SCH5428379]